MHRRLLTVSLMVVVQKVHPISRLKSSHVFKNKKIQSHLNFYIMAVWTCPLLQRLGWNLAEEADRARDASLISSGCDGCRCRFLCDHSCVSVFPAAASRQGRSPLVLLPSARPPCAPAWTTPPASAQVVEHLHRNDFCNRDTFF